MRIKSTVYDAVDFGLIETEKEQSPGNRLQKIESDLEVIIKRHNPDIMAIEKIFFATNAKTAIRVGQALGVMLLTAAKTNIEVVEYAPGTIKKVVAGNGRADKKDMQRELRKVLGAKVRASKHKKTHFDNAADGLAVALCHAYSIKGGDK